MTTTDDSRTPWADAMFADIGPARAARMFMMLADVLHPANDGDAVLFRELCDAYQPYLTCYVKDA